MLIVSVLMMTVGYTLMYAGVRMPIKPNGLPDTQYVFQPWRLWLYAGQQMSKAALPQLQAQQQGQSAFITAVTHPANPLPFTNASPGLNL